MKIIFNGKVAFGLIFLWLLYGNNFLLRGSAFSCLIKHVLLLIQFYHTLDVIWMLLTGLCQYQKAWITRVATLRYSVLINAEAQVFHTQVCSIMTNVIVGQRMINLGRSVILNAILNVAIHLVGCVEQHGGTLCTRHVSCNAFSYISLNPIFVLLCGQTSSDHTPFL